MTDPRRRDGRRPLELVGLSAVVAVVVGLVVLIATREARLALTWAGVAFVVVVVVVAMLVLASGPGPTGRKDDDGPQGH